MTKWIETLNRFSGELYRAQELETQKSFFLHQIEQLLLFGCLNDKNDKLLQSITFFFSDTMSLTISV